jgi:phage baseplate assembly protein V
MTARRDPELTELNRRVAGMVTIGTVSQVEPKLARYRVKAGLIESDWIPMSQRRSGNTKTYESLDVGEQVVIAAPSGDLSQGVIIGSIPTEEREVGEDAKDHRSVYADGAIVDYDDKAHAYNIKIPAGGKVVISVGDTRLEMSSDGIKLYTPDFEAIRT